MADVKFKLKRSNDLRQPYYFTIVSTGNGKTLATSETYVAKQSALDTMNLIYGAMKGEVKYDDET